MHFINFFGKIERDRRNTNNFQTRSLCRALHESSFVRFIVSQNLENIRKMIKIKILGTSFDWESTIRRQRAMVSMKMYR